MTEDENIVKRTCKELQEEFAEFDNKLINFDEKICQALVDYMYNDVYNVKLTKKEYKDILKKCDFVHSLKNYRQITSKDIHMYLNGSISFTEDGLKVANDMVAFGGVFKELLEKTKAKQYITKKELEDITPLYVKEFIKDKKWTYKDLAEAIGAGESTLKAWISKGEIPEWAKRTILLMQKVDNLTEEQYYEKAEFETIKEQLKNFKDLLNNI